MDSAPNTIKLVCKDKNSSNECSVNVVEYDPEVIDIDFGSKNEESSKPLPDGGYGWIVVAASFSVMFVIYGVLYSFGQITDYYDVTDGPFKGKKKSLAFVVTANIAVLNASSIFTGRLDDRFGHKKCVFGGAIVYALAFFLSSFATEVWHLILTQGVLCGLSGSILSIATISAPMQWFEKRRGLASGISMAGSGLGGFVLSPLVTELLKRFEVAWVMRGLALAFLIILSLSALVIRDQEASAPADDIKWYDCSILKNMMFVLLLAGNTIGALGYMVPLVRMPNYVNALGFSSTDSGMIIAATNGVSAVSRVVGGVMADKYGSINTLILSLILIALSTSLGWAFSTSLASLYVFSVFFGLGLGGFVSLPPVVSSKLFGVKGLSTINGWIYFAAGLPVLIGVPIADAIEEATKVIGDNPVEKFKWVIQYTGLTALGSIVFLVFLKFRVNPKILGRI